VPIRIMIVDDHCILRAGLRVLLQAKADIAVVGEASGMGEAVRMTVELKPDVVLMDINLPDGSGIEATRAIKQSCPDVQVLMLTIYGDPETVFEAVQAGAIGYVLKDIHPEHLASAIRSVHTNRTMINPVIARKMVERLATTGREALMLNLRRGSGLTDREIEVLKGVTEGWSDKELALKLFLSEATIKSHLRSIYRKLQVRNRAQAAAYAVQKGLSP